MSCAACDNILPGGLAAYSFCEHIDAAKDAAAKEHHGIGLFPAAEGGEIFLRERCHIAASAEMSKDLEVFGDFV